MKILFSPSEMKSELGGDTRICERNFIFADLYEKRLQMLRLRGVYGGGERGGALQTFRTENGTPPCAKISLKKAASRHFCATRVPRIARWAMRR